MNSLPLSVESALSEIWANESAKSILEKYCSAMTSDPRFKSAMNMTLNRSGHVAGKITPDIYDLLQADQLPKAGCKNCGEALPAA
jgi:hypothetical protein